MFRAWLATQRGRRRVPHGGLRAVREMVVLDFGQEKGVLLLTHRYVTLRFITRSDAINLTRVGVKCLLKARQVGNDLVCATAVGADF